MLVHTVWYDSHETDVITFTTEVSVVNLLRGCAIVLLWCQQNIFRNFLGNSDHCPFLTSKFSRKTQKRKKVNYGLRLVTVNHF